MKKSVSYLCFVVALSYSFYQGRWIKLQKKHDRGTLLKPSVEIAGVMSFHSLLLSLSIFPPFYMELRFCQLSSTQLSQTHYPWPIVFLSDPPLSSPFVISAVVFILFYCAPLNPSLISRHVLVCQSDRETLSLPHSSFMHTQVHSGHVGHPGAYFS